MAICRNVSSVPSLATRVARASRLLAEPNAVGIFAFPLSYAPLKELSVSSVDGLQPSIQSIEGGTYPGSRELYLYIDRQRVPFYLVRQLIAAPVDGPDSALVAPSPPDSMEIMKAMSAP